MKDKMKSMNVFIKMTLLCFLISCTFNKNETTNKNTSINSFFDEADLGAFGSKTRLLINAHFSECGEWGGHIEEMKIYAKVDKDFYLDYRKFKVKCDSVNPNYGQPFQILDIEKTIKIDDYGKKSISDYILRMTKSKIEEKFPGVNSFSVVKSDSTLIIKVNFASASNYESYKRLLTELKLE